MGDPTTDDLSYHHDKTTNSQRELESNVSNHTTDGTGGGGYPSQFYDLTAPRSQLLKKFAQLYLGAFSASIVAVAIIFAIVFLALRYGDVMNTGAWFCIGWLVSLEFYFSIAIIQAQGSHFTFRTQPITYAFGIPSLIAMYFILRTTDRLDGAWNILLFFIPSLVCGMVYQYMTNRMEIRRLHCEEGFAAVVGFLVLNVMIPATGTVVITAMISILAALVSITPKLSTHPSVNVITVMSWPLFIWLLRAVCIDHFTRHADAIAKREAADEVEKEKRRSGLGKGTEKGVSSASFGKVLKTRECVDGMVGIISSKDIVVSVPVTVSTTPTPLPPTPSTPPSLPRTGASIAQEVTNPLIMAIFSGNFADAQLYSVYSTTNSISFSLALSSFLAFLVLESLWGTWMVGKLEDRKKMGTVKWVWTCLSCPRTYLLVTPEQPTFHDLYRNFQIFAKVVGMVASTFRFILLHYLPSIIYTTPNPCDLSTLFGRHAYLLFSRPIYPPSPTINTDPTDFISPSHPTTGLDILTGPRILLRVFIVWVGILITGLLIVLLESRYGHNPLRLRKFDARSGSFWLSMVSSTVVEQLVFYLGVLFLRSGETGWGVGGGMMC